ncbi:MAG TPA: TetR/AcrR family transcriptional regulator [Symbiobacteriaceae bacterium]|nr:TetR/AcrR family transcriptional regulator [Symbiobacteriaceae bacterium]
MADERDDQVLVGEFRVVPQQDRALVKREALLASARLLFAELGYERTTAKEIAKHAGVAVGTFYRYFTDKRQILVTLLQDRIEELLPPTPQWLKGDPEAVLTEILERHFTSKCALGLSGALQEMLLREPDLANPIQEAHQQAHDRLVGGLKQARELGLLWPDIDLDRAGWAIITLVEKGSEAYRPVSDPDGPRRLAKLICRMVMPPEVQKQY